MILIHTGNSFVERIFDFIVKFSWTWYIECLVMGSGTGTLFCFYACGGFMGYQCTYDVQQHTNITLVYIL